MFQLVKKKRLNDCASALLNQFRPWHLSVGSAQLGGLGFALDLHDA